MVRYHHALQTTMKQIKKSAMAISLFILGILTILTCILQHYGIFNKLCKSSNDETSQTPQPASNESTEYLDDNQLKDCLDMNNNWIGIADQKAGILLATLGIAFTIFLTSDAIKVIRNVLILPFVNYLEKPELYDFIFSRFAVFVFLVVTGLMAIISLLYLLNVIKPNINYKKFYEDNPGLVSNSYIYYKSVAEMKFSEFKNARVNYTEDLRSQVFVNAKIASTKFNNYLEGFFWFKMMLLSAAMLFISIMFVQ